MATIKSFDGREFDGYLAIPASGYGPGIVVIQEVFGVNAFMRSVTDWYASHGFVALCPDLFWRLEPGIERHHGKSIEKGTGCIGDIAVGSHHDFHPGDDADRPFLMTRHLLPSFGHAVEEVDEDVRIEQGLYHSLRAFSWNASPSVDFPRHSPNASSAVARALFST